MNDFSFGRKLKFDASGNVLPSINNVLNLGSPDYRWKDLYLSGNTIDISGTRLSRHVDGSLMVHDVSGNYMPGRFKDVSTTGIISSVGNINTTANLGVGTDNPTYKLHVIGDTRIQGDLVVNGTQTLVNTDIQVTDQVVITNAGTGPALVVTQSGVETIADFCDETSGNIVMRVANGGNVGIGVSNPSAKLDVSGNSYFRGNTSITGNQLLRYGINNSRGYVELRFNNNGIDQGSGAGLILASDEVSSFSPVAIIDTWTSGVSGNPPLLFKTRGSERMRLNDNGNVGIGNTNPQATLDVSGNMFISNTPRISNVIAFAGYYYATNNPTFSTNTKYKIANAQLFNYGNGLNTSTGIFTAPIKGIYQFNAVANVYNASGYRLYITIGIYIVSISYIGSAADHTGNGSITVQLNQGETIDGSFEVRGATATYAISATSSTVYTRFDGHLLYAIP